MKTPVQNFKLPANLSPWFHLPLLESIGEASLWSTSNCRLVRTVIKIGSCSEAQSNYFFKDSCSLRLGVSLLKNVISVLLPATIASFSLATAVGVQLTFLYICSALPSSCCGNEVCVQQKLRVSVASVQCPALSEGEGGGTQAIHTCTELERNMVCGKPELWVEFGLFGSFTVCRIAVGIRGWDSSSFCSTICFCLERHVEHPAQFPLVFPDASN